jgi:hypothetical protein
MPIQEPLRIGDPSQRMRVISTSFDGHRYVAHLVGLRGRSYTLRTWVPFVITRISGAERPLDDRIGGVSSGLDLTVTFTGDTEWVSKDVVIELGRRIR